MQSLARLLLISAVSVLSGCFAFDPRPPEGLEVDPERWTDPNGCSGKYCARCLEPAHCQALEACLPSGTCGPCESDAQCSDGRSCLQGACVAAHVDRIFDLTMDPEELENLVAHPWDDIVVQAELTALGQDFGACEVKLRGASSRDYEKKSFKLTFPEDAPHPGYSRKINLRAEFADPSYLRNFLAMEAFRRFSDLPTPRVQYTWLRINGEDYGLFAEVERVGGKFLKDNSRSKANGVFESDPPLDLFAGGAGGLIVIDDTTLYSEAYDHKSGDGDFSSVAALTAELRLDHEDSVNVFGSTDRIREEVELSGYLDYLALMTVTQNEDYVRKNFYFSQQLSESGGLKWEFYPWDLDLSLGCLFQEEERGLCTKVSADGRYDIGVKPPSVMPEYPMAGHFNLLINQVLRDLDLFEAYRARVCGIIESPLWQDGFPKTIDAMSASIRSSVEADPLRRLTSIEDFDAAVADLHWFVEARAAHLRDTLSCK